MYHRPEQTLEQYEIDIKAITKGRDCHVCETDKGTFMLKEYRRSEERLTFLDGMLNYLNSEGVCTESIWRTKEGGLIASEDDRRYILVTSLHGAECSTRDRDDILGAVTALAKFHAAAGAYEGEVPESVRECTSDHLAICEKHNRELLKVRNYIRSKKKKNEFEMLFASCYDAMMEKALAVTEHIRRQTCEGNERKCFCHGDYNQHNVIFAGGMTAIVHFDNYCYNERLLDLANFMRKILEKNNWNMGLGIDMIRAYGRIMPFEGKETAILYGYMAYPEKFWKVANRYFNSHKAWVSGRNIEKLEKLIALEKSREEFVQMLFQFINQ